MDMATTTQEKDIQAIADIIQQHYLASGDESVGVPVKYFEQKSFGHHDVKIALSILTKSGAVQNYHRCWGHNDIDKQSGTVSFTEVDTKEPKEKFEGVVQAFEAYHILIKSDILKQLAQPSKKSARSSKAKEDVAIQLFLDNDGDLYKEPKKSYCYPLLQNKEPLKLILYFIKNPNRSYEESTQMIALSLEKDPQYLRAEIGKINRIALNRLGLGKEKLIQAKQNSGYRLNPKIKITAEKEILLR